MPCARGAGTAGRTPRSLWRKPCLHLGVGPLASRARENTRVRPRERVRAAVCASFFRVPTPPCSVDGSFLEWDTAGGRPALRRHGDAPHWGRWPQSREGAVRVLPLLSPHRLGLCSARSTGGGTAGRDHCSSCRREPQGGSRVSPQGAARGSACKLTSSEPVTRQRQGPCREPH